MCFFKRILGQFLEMSIFLSKQTNKQTNNNNKTQKLSFKIFFFFAKTESLTLSCCLYCFVLFVFLLFFFLVCLLCFSLLCFFFISLFTWVFFRCNHLFWWSPGPECTEQFDCRDEFSLLVCSKCHISNRVPKCDVIKVSFSHFSIFMTIFQ